MAEQDGWSAVTVRRLADQIEYSQPVLYSHFADKTAIIRAVAVDGFAELADVLRQARSARRTPRTALRAVIAAYLDFATAQPALYEAMFSRFAALDFGPDTEIEELSACFTELAVIVTPFAGGRSVGSLAEVLWSTLHGLASLAKDGRLPAAGLAARLAITEELFTTPAF